MKGIRFVLAAFALLATTSPSLGQLRKDKPLINAGYDLGKPLHFGFSMGINFMDAEVKNNQIVVQDEYGKNVLLWSDVTSITPGFNVNIISELRIKENLSLRFLPGMAFGQRTLSFYEIKPGMKKLDSLYHQMKIESSMIEFPLQLKYSAKRHSNSKPYLIGGINPRYDLASKKKFSEGVYVAFDPLDVYVEFGVGIDFYLPYFKFSTELKYSRGFFDVLSSRTSEGYEYFPKTINGVLSDMIVLSFHFE